MADKKTGLKINPLFTKTEQENTESNDEINKYLNKEINEEKKTDLITRTTLLEKEVYEMLRRYSFEKRVKMYAVINQAVKEYIQNHS